MSNMHPGTRTVPTEMSGSNSSDINSRANETFGETYARLQREAWASGSSLDGLARTLFGSAADPADCSAGRSARTSAGERYLKSWLHPGGIKAAFPFSRRERRSSQLNSSSRQSIWMVNLGRQPQLLHFKESGVTNRGDSWTL